VNDDLAALFADPPAGPSQDVRFRQGVIVTFNPLTLENTVNVGGTVMANLPLAGVGEATLLVPGAVVGIMCVGDAAKTMYITGRIVTPNTADATSAISLLNSQIKSDFIMTDEATTSTAYTDLATIGPRVTVPVGPTGRILVVASAQMNGTTNFANATSGDNRFNLEMTGANTQSPSDVTGLLLGIWDFVIGIVDVGTPTLSYARAITITAQAVFSGLNPGDTTITMKYRNAAGASNSASFARRTLTVIKL